MRTILGIESSCDETAAAVVVDGRLVLSSLVASQHETHAPYGGVVPELAARAHVDRIDTLINDALVAADVKAHDLSAVAVTMGPGLAGALLVGMAAAKGLCVAADLPLVGVNHLEAHVFANVIDFDDFQPPAVVLLVSGGHTLLAHMREDYTFELLGETLDDAVGEAYDKIARFVGLGYPGGPLIDKLAAQGDPKALKFPRAMLRDGYDFSFSGLKTAVVARVKRAQASGEVIAAEDLAASFQQAVVDVLITKTMRAASDIAVKKIALAGGVAANSWLREQLTAVCVEKGFECFVPSLALCGDNAAMVTAAADRRVQRQDFDSLDLPANPSLSL